MGKYKVEYVLKGKGEIEISAQNDDAIYGIIDDFTFKNLDKSLSRSLLDNIEEFNVTVKRVELEEEDA